jgi:uncharacterized caspase-like protein
MRKNCALVIGNNNYSRYHKFSGAVKDAAAVAEGLKKINFEVTLLTDSPPPPHQVAVSFRRYIL